MKIKRLTEPLKNEFNNSYRKRIFKTITFSFISICLIIILISVVYFYAHAKDMVSSLKESYLSVLEKTSVVINESLSQTESIALHLSVDTQRLITSNSDPISCDYYRLHELSSRLIDIKNSYAQIHSIYVYFNQGHVISTSFMGTTSFRLFHDTDWYPEYARHSKEMIWLFGRNPFNQDYNTKLKLLDKYDINTNVTVNTLLVPLSESLKSMGGVIVVNVYQSKLKELISNYGNGSEVYLTDSEGKILLSSSTSSFLGYVNDDIISNVKQTSGNFITYEDKVVYLYVYLFNNENIMLARYPLNNILSSSKSILFTLIIISAVTILFICILIFIVIRQSNRSLHSFYSALKKQSFSEESIKPIIENSPELLRIWENNRTLVKHRTLTSIINGTFDATTSIDRLKYLGIDFPYSSFVCVILHIDVPFKSHKLLDDEYEAIKMQLFPIVNECIKSIEYGHTVDIDDLNIGIILNIKVYKSNEIFSLIEEVKESISSSITMKYSTSYGIGPCVNSLENIPTTFEGACIASQYAQYIGGNEIINYSNVSSFEIGNSQRVTNNIELSLISSLRVGDYENCKKAIDRLVAQKETQPIDIQKQALIHVMSEIRNCIQETDMKDLANKLFDDIATFVNESYYDARDYLYCITEKICSFINSNQETKNNETIRPIIEYIDKNYAKEISLSNMASQVYMSVPYFCTVFKETSGITFNNYLTKKRIEAATELLKDNSKNLQAISDKVGFSNIQAFIRAFKKHVNMTPTEFRESIINDNKNNQFNNKL